MQQASKIVSIRAALINALAQMNESEAFNACNALAQWVDNQRNYVEETDVNELEPRACAELAAAQKLVDAFERALAALS